VAIPSPPCPKASPHCSKNPPRAKWGAPPFAENQPFVLKFCEFQPKRCINQPTTHQHETKHLLPRTAGRPDCLAD
jgi:hypothetical protein